MGAIEVVIDTNTLTHVKAVEGPAFKRNVKFEGAIVVIQKIYGNKKS